MLSLIRVICPSLGAEPKLQALFAKAVLGIAKYTKRKKTIRVEQTTFGINSTLAYIGSSGQSQESRIMLSRGYERLFLGSRPKAMYISKKTIIKRAKAIKALALISAN